VSAAHDLLVVGVNPAIDIYYCLDRIQVGEVNRVGSVRVAPGGKANNLARAYHRLGGSPLTTGIAGGETGRRILAGLSAEGIAHDYVIADGESRQTVTLNTPDATTVLLEPGPPVSETTLTALIAKVAALAAGSPIVAVVGSLPPGAPSDYIAQLILTIRSTSSALIAIDTSGEALERATLAGPNLIKVNVDEYERAFRTSARDQSAVERHFCSLAERGLETLCLTDGARGALVLSAGDPFVIRTDVTNPIATVGAGDAFLAGLLSAPHRGDDLRAAAYLASAAAAAAVQSVGAGFIEPSVFEAA
jgi:tagatose 6-phosphate kinase